MDSAPLTLIIHDYDPVAAEDRRTDLLATIAGAEVRAISRRRELLTAVSELPPVDRRARRPLALIDLQGEDDRTARGEHLLATINEHPSLQDRVALVAFTRYGFAQRDEILKAKGARAVLNPVNLHRQDGLAGELDLLATGSSPFVHIGEPPSRNNDKEVVEKLATFFPELHDDSISERARWERAREILRACQLDREGFDDKEIIARVPKVGKRGLRRLQDQLLASPAAIAAELIAPMEKRPSLGRVIDELAPYLDETPLIWVVTNERERLEGPGHLAWVRERVADRYPPEGAPPAGDDAWIPPDYLDVLRRYLDAHAALSRGIGGGNFSTAALFQRTQAAIEHIAAELDLDPEQARHYASHAVMCLEDAEAERSGEA